MIKIKDDVDLSILTNYGFVFDEDRYSVHFGMEGLSVIVKSRRLIAYAYNTWGVAENCLGLVCKLAKEGLTEEFVDYE